MTKPERYFIGPSMKAKLADVVSRVGDMPIGGGSETIAVRLQDMTRSRGGGNASLRDGTFTGSWPKGSTAVVTFTNAPTATASVTNLTWPLGNCSLSTTKCLVASEGTAWALVVPDLTAMQGYNAAAIQLLGHSASGCLRWYDVANCESPAPSDQSWLF